jgi:predicted RecB family nuclease
MLNKHCPSCPFRDACLQRAEKEDNLSLLDRMTPKLMRKGAAPAPPVPLS